MTTEPQPFTSQPTDHDTTDLRALNDARRLLDAAGVATAVVDREGVLRSTSSMFAAAFDARPDEIVGRHLMDLTDESDRANVLAGLARLTNGAQHRTELTLSHLHSGSAEVGGTLAVGTVGTSHDPALPLLAVLTLDDPAPAATATVLHRPGIDPLTGLGDSLRRDDALAGAIARSRRTGHALAVLQCRPRDPQQPLRGDLPLAEIGRRMVDELRDTDVVCRVGDDLFVVAEHLGDEQDAAGVAYRLMSTLIAPVNDGGADLKVSLTVGISVADGAASPKAMLEAAGDAFDDARADGMGSFRIVDLRTGRAA
jgi:GGDEF domain-containing protein